MRWDARSSRSDLGGVGMEIFLQRGLDSPFSKRPDGQITRRRREQILSCPGRGAAFSRRSNGSRECAPLRIVRSRCSASPARRVLPRAVEGRSSLLRRLHIGKCQRAQLFAVKVDEAQTPPMRNQARRQRVVAERAAAEVRRQAADIGERVDFDAQQMECCAVGGDQFERDAAEAQKAAESSPDRARQ